MPTTLVIGFDSAWSGNNSGAIVGVLKQEDASYVPLGNPLNVNFDQATQQINDWKKERRPVATLILIDQPIVVPNMNGQRPVENIVGSPVSKRYGGVQPANRSKVDMFGDNAPIWQFLNQHSALLNPTTFVRSQQATWVIETYPVLTLIALNWLRDDDPPSSRPTGRLPKYNPANKNFSPDGWKFVFKQAAETFKQMGLQHLVEWIDSVRNNPLPASRREQKQLQDRLDACLCLLVGLRLIEGEDCLFVGNMETGYMVVPYGINLYQELENRCNETEREPADWLRNFKIC